MFLSQQCHIWSCECGQRSVHTIVEVSLVPFQWKVEGSPLPLPTPSPSAGAGAFFALYAVYMVVMAWNVTLDPFSPKWSILLKQACAIVTAVALIAFVPLSTQLLLC